TRCLSDWSSDVCSSDLGAYDDSVLLDTSAERFEELLRVNLIGAFLGMQAAVDPMRTRGGGVIVNIASGSAWRGQSAGAAYAASKIGRASCRERGEMSRV